MCNLYNITANKPQSSISVSSSQSLHWQLTADAWRLPDYPAPVIRDGHKARDGDDALGDAATATHRRASSHEYPKTSSPHWRMWLKPENRCLVPANSFAEYAPDPNPETKKKDVVWFALPGMTNGRAPLDAPGR